MGARANVAWCAVFAHGLLNDRPGAGRISQRTSGIG
jgi:hypothetical protein